LEKKEVTGRIITKSLGAKEEKKLNGRPRAARTQQSGKGERIRVKRHEGRRVFLHKPQGTSPVKKEEGETEGKK